MKKYDFQKILLDYVFVISGCVLIAFAITSILKSNGLVTGGITGISIILEKITSVQYTYTYTALSLMVLISAWIILGRAEGLKIISISVMFPVILIVFERMSLHFIENDMTLASVYYGIIAGTGCGLILKRGFSQGGTDTIAKIIHNKFFTFVGINEILLVIDGAIIIVSGILYDRNVALYAIISQIIFMKAVDIVLFGFGSKKVKIEIISDKNDEISKYILHTIKRGISSYEIKGGYMNLLRQKLVTICSTRESMLIKHFIAHTDPDAFVNVLPVNSVWGKGLGFDSLIEQERI